MPDLFEQIEMPGFSPAYDPKTKYGYTNPHYKRNLKELLNKTSEGFCMYCYVTVAADGKLWGHLEHSIEKTNSKYLTECIPNIGWTCSVCNDIFKKYKEKERKLSQKDITIFERKIKCSSNRCTKACAKYKNLKNKYLRQENAQIILQPNGVKGFDTGFELKIQYNVQNGWFEPSAFQGEYSEQERQFIEKHINRFHLNDEAYRTNALITFFEDVIEGEGHIVRTPENNMVVRVFKKRLEGLERQDVLRICKKLYTYYMVKLKA